MYDKGVIRKGEIKAHYNINREGWNSNKEYFEEKSDRKRIAVIGDSYVEALNVDVDKSLSEVLEDLIIREIGDKAEVYRFGLSGAPLSQYLQMMRYVKNKYNPDIIILVIVHNDFLESIKGFGEELGDFLKFVKKDGLWTEIKPRPYAYVPNRFKRSLKHSRIIRYLYYNLNIRQSIHFLSSKFKASDFKMNVDMNDIEANLETVKDLCYNIFSKYKETSGPATRILLVMDGDREAIYKRNDPKKEMLYALNKIAYKAAENLSIPFIDLNDIFIADYEKNWKQFDLKCDKHWNERAHFLVGRTIANFILEHRWCSYDAR
jgi:lysophospholipase L1-like esterase